MNTYKLTDLVNIFTELEKTFFSQSDLTKAQLTKNLKSFKKIKKQKRDDNDYFWVMVYVTFYSGFKAKTVTDKIQAIKEIFGDYEKVAKYDEIKIQKIIDSKKVIGHRQKINGIIYNANQIKAIKKQFGSFYNYLNSFGETENDTILFELIKDLKKRFKYLGGITVFHFLTDIGFNVLKPDRVLCRIFHRLGLVDSEEDLFGVIAAGRKFASATDLPIRYIDIIFVAYGQVDAKPEFGLKEGICLSNSPKCELCGIYKFCQYKKKKKLT
ncbi:MAG: DNA-3-methyladenine glycosylase I [Bacteroidales bacterium]|nr:DNA-3-methyladenine glycosylase I [Bacteroidales bacterium]